MARFSVLISIFIMPLFLTSLSIASDLIASAIPSLELSHRKEFQLQYVKALRAATQRLKQNHHYVFLPNLLPYDFHLGGLGSTWQKVDCPKTRPRPHDQIVDRCFAPKEGKIVEALTEVYSHPFASDCQTGIQIAELAAIRELFGDENLKKHFHAMQFMIGDFHYVNESQNLTRGKGALRSFPIDLAQARLGSWNMVGLVGSIYSKFGNLPSGAIDHKFLDDPANVNENFVIVEMSAAAAAKFVENGEQILHSFLKTVGDDSEKLGTLLPTPGQQYYANLLSLLWTQSQQLSPPEKKAIENYFSIKQRRPLTAIELQRWMPDNAINGQTISEAAVRWAKELSDPFLAETVVYVHPVGEKSFSWHLARLAQLNPRTPYMIRFDPSYVQWGLFNLWKELR